MATPAKYETLRLRASPVMESLGTRREYMRRHHGKRINFIAPGVERQFRQQRGLLYGTENDHTDSRPSDSYTRASRGTCVNQSSWEKLKMQKQYKDAEKDLQSHEKAKRETQHQMKEEKRQDLHMLQSYNPWGKPSPGAPRWTQSGTLLARGNASISRQQEEETTETEDNEVTNDPFGRPGAGAPLRSRDGHVDTSIRAHPETRFQKHLRKEVENSLRYKGAVEGQAVAQPPLTRTVSEEKRETQRRSQQSKYAQRLEDQMEEALEKKRQDALAPTLSYFPWGQSGPRRDDSGKLLSRQRPRPHPPHTEYQSIVDHMERMGRRGHHMTSRCTHPFTHGSRCHLKMDSYSQGPEPENPPPTISPAPDGPKKATPTINFALNRIWKSHSLPVTSLQQEAEQRHQQRRREREEGHQQRRREREEGRSKRNSHHALWEGGLEN